MTRQKKHLRRSKRGKIFRAGRKNFSSIDTELLKYTEKGAVVKDNIYMEDGQLYAPKGTTLTKQKADYISSRLRTGYMTPYGRLSQKERMNILLTEPEGPAGWKPQYRF